MLSTLITSSDEIYHYGVFHYARALFLPYCPPMESIRTKKPARRAIRIYKPNVGRLEASTDFSNGTACSPSHKRATTPPVHQLVYYASGGGVRHETGMDAKRFEGMLKVAGNNASPHYFTLLPATFSLLGNKRFSSAVGDAPTSARLSHLGARLSDAGDPAVLRAPATKPRSYSKSKTSASSFASQIDKCKVDVWLLVQLFLTVKETAESASKQLNATSKEFEVESANFDRFAESDNSVEDDEDEDDD